jgi:hypothetical protein
MSMSSTASQPLDADLIPWLTYRGLLLGSLQVLAVLCLVAQLAIDPSADNVECVALVVASSSLMLQYLWRSEAMTTHPLSSLALLGFTASSQLVALISQTLDLTSFIQHLRAPHLTFTVLAVAHATAVGSHFVYRHFQPLSGSASFLAVHVFGPLNIHRIPTPTAVWLLGAIGMVGLVLGGGGMGDVGGKTLAGLSFLVWLPFMLPIYRDRIGEHQISIAKHLPFMITWALVIAVVALGRNQRGLMLFGPVQLAIVFTVYRCMGNEKIRWSFLKKLSVAAVLMAALMPQISDFLLAMQISREKRGTLTPYEQLVETFDVFTDKDRLANVKSSFISNLFIDPYDESYLTNVALTRFTETKFHDNMLFFSRFLNQDDIDGLIAHQVDRVVALLPQNVLDGLKIKLDKFSLNYSNGDYYLNRALGAPLGSFATGSMWADLYLVAGPWLPFAASIMFWLVFIALDSLCRLGPGFFISPIALGTAYTIYLNGLAGESVFAKVAYVTRGLIQPVLLYTACLLVVAFFLQLMKKSAWASSDTDPSTHKPTGLQ